MKQIALILSIFILLSCSNTSKTEEGKLDDIEKKEEPSHLLNNIQNTQLETENQTAPVFNFLKIEFEEWSGNSINAVKLLRQAFLPKYNRTKPSYGFDWDVTKVLLISEDMLAMVVESFEEGITIKHLVTIDNNDYIHNFDKLGTDSDSKIEVTLINPETGEVRVTERRTAIIGNNFVKKLELTNTYFAIENNKYVQQENVTIERIFNSAFNLNIPDYIDTVLSVYPHFSDNSKLIIDTYLGDLFYSRLPPHYSNNWMPDAVDEIEFLVQDFNQDGKLDVMITVPAITGVGSNGTTPFKVLSIYFQNNELSFSNFIEIDEKLAEGKSIEELQEICREISFGYQDEMSP